MSLFQRIFVGDGVPTEDPVAPAQEATSDSPFTSYIKDVIRFGMPPITEKVEEAGSETAALEDELQAWAATEIDLLDTEVYDEDEETEEVEDVEEQVDDRPVIEEKQEIVHQPATSPLPPSDAPTVIQASSSEQKDDKQVNRIVDILFDRMQTVWGPQQQHVQVEDKQPTKPSKGSSYELTQTKRELTQMIRREVPQAMKTEIAAVMRTEISNLMRTEIMHAIRDEFATVSAIFDKLMDRLHAMESRLAQIEGSVGKEIKVNFPKGAVQIKNEIEIPEREVKIAAPINVQPPSVTFDQGAINVQFMKSDKPKHVKFERDPLSQDIKGATIISNESEDLTVN